MTIRKYELSLITMPRNHGVDYERSRRGELVALLSLVYISYWIGNESDGNPRSIIGSSGAPDSCIGEGLSWSFVLYLSKIFLNPCKISVLPLPFYGSAVIAQSVQFMHRRPVYQHFDI